MPSVDHTLDIAADPAAILNAFFDPGSLGRWWKVERSVTTPRILGVYAIQWPPTPFVDEVFGPLGGVLHGTVVDYRPDREFLVAEVHWLPPAGEPVGPMALHVSAIRQAGASVTKLRVLQTGGDDTARWRRYYELMANGWTGSLAALKEDVERGAKADAAASAPGQATR